MADPSLLPMDYRYTNPNYTSIWPNLFQDTTTVNPTTVADDAVYSTTALYLFESLSSLVTLTLLKPKMSSENGTDTQERGLTTGIGDWDPCDTENPKFNCSVLDFLEYYQGPQMMPFLKAIMVR